jgi:hypothetical protein
MTIVVNKYKHIPTDKDVYCGRGSIFGNQFIIGKDGGREEVIVKHKQYVFKRIEQDKEFLQKILDLKDHNLVCFCKPKACHCDTYIEIIDKFDKNDS